MAIYTPGSNAGLPVSILSSLNAPDEAMMEDRELLADRISSTVSSMLGLMGVDADPVQSKEHILLSNIVAYFWAKNQNLSLEVLVRAIQQPPIRKVGVVDIDTFLPEGKRSDLAMKLNNLLASPGFGVWLEGEPLDIQRMYFTPEGKPRISIFCISHLSDTERMFFVSLLMNQLLGWMRQPERHHQLACAVLHGRDFWLPPTHRQSAVEEANDDTAKAGAGVWVGPAVRHAEPGGFGLQSVIEHRDLVFGTIANGARHAAGVGWIARRGFEQWGDV
jgi:hypothetical protein